MSEWNGFTRIKKTRKKHRCEITQELIPEGSSCWRFVGHWDGEFQNWYCCNKAKEFMESNSEYSSGYCDEIGEAMREMGYIK